MTTTNQSKIQNLKSEIKLADRAGLEPATSDLTGRHSNRLSYLSIKLKKTFSTKIPNYLPVIEMVGKRGKKCASADKRQVCSLQTKDRILSILLSSHAFRPRLYR